MSKSSSENILVIGGSGFMGSHTADELSKRGNHVTIFDCVHSPYIRSDQSMIVGDMMNVKDLNKAFKNIDYVYYLAGVADIGEAKSNPFDTIEKNIMGVKIGRAHV